MNETQNDSDDYVLDTLEVELENQKNMLGDAQDEEHKKEFERRIAQLEEGIRIHKKYKEAL